MRLWRFDCVLRVGRSGRRHASTAAKALPVRMIGVVHKVFPDRGYGFVLAVPPPASLLSTAPHPASSTTMEEIGEDAQITASVSQSLSQGDPLSVWFLLRKGDASTTETRGKLEGAASPPTPLPGSYVSFSATCHYDKAKQTHLWRAQEVVPCDPEEELQAALRRVRDKRWDCITSEDVRREMRQVARRYLLEEQRAVKSASRKDDDAAAEASQRSLREGEMVDDIAMEELQMQLTQERVRRHFHHLNKASQRFFVREVDLRRPMISAQKDMEMQTNPEGDVVAVGRWGFSDDERRRWERVLQCLKEQE
ncbi:hypothetical protein C3747_115g149 [Trypanosoma cruzi]|uniref:Uncharacterized protein n=2 Tax=Trypanosoma cruzi TaxID=5693 RepID=Q4CMI1_TRYCC|nr:hypothetical protein, conserved [Trypanosoma cruzi]EAN81482.1 hypothetical protein, conserved [Trypanosoma cruzi]PWV06405.1 hypothetical protein C3747_115g149 [Trypanosoma cruzi]RNC56550.1 hypothetical protein TcCL_ESM05871 [Trypanosoma cruzi]|eukprot:XP_802928.1 hypothetical protein [Trypanosoma cruzi strain CL Brener]